jgi:hypothetical protein
MTASRHQFETVIDGRLTDLLVRQDGLVGAIAQAGWALHGRQKE